MSAFIGLTALSEALKRELKKTRLSSSFTQTDLGNMLLVEATVSLLNTLMPYKAKKDPQLSQAEDLFFFY
jgi:hypothetical protein